MNKIVKFLINHTDLSEKDISHMPHSDMDRRLKSSWKYLLSGYTEDPDLLFKNKFSYCDDKNPVTCNNIRFYSMCEHHFLPFYGIIDITYIANSEGNVGVSKLPRLVDIFARRLQSQEKLTKQIGNSLMRHSEGVAVYSKAHHLCMSMRGIKAENTTNYVSFFFGGSLNTQEFKRSFIHAK